MAFISDVNKLYSIVCSDSLDDYGYVLELDTSTAKAKKHTGTEGHPIIGVAISSTEDPTDEGTYLSNEEVAVQHSGIAMVALKAANAAIVAGDLVGAVSGGVVDKFSFPTASADPTQAEVQSQSRQMVLIVGIALEDKAESSGGHIKVMLRNI